MAIQKKIWTDRASNVPTNDTDITYVESIVLARWDDSDLENDVEFIVCMVLRNSANSMQRFDRRMRARFSGQVVAIGKSDQRVTAGIDANNFELITFECDASGRGTYQSNDLDASYTTSSFDAFFAGETFSENGLFALKGEISQPSWNAHNRIIVEQFV